MNLWNDSNLPPLTNQWAYDRARSNASKADILRYELLLKYGGVYIDVDFECCRNLGHLISELDCFAAREKISRFENGAFALVNNAILGAVPHHPFICDLVKHLETHVHSLPPGTTAAQQTGPLFLTEVLHYHPEVHVFPSALFYPYEADQRWRRTEHFPEAYAIHHWTLSDLALSHREDKSVGRDKAPCITVALHPVTHDDGIRLEWVLEGLCAQTASEFEVILVNCKETPYVSKVAERFRKRLTLNFLNVPSLSLTPRSSPAIRNLTVQLAKADRILFLDADTIPDQDVVETHCVYRDRHILLFGYRRIYPIRKLFNYRDTIAYSQLVSTSRPEQTNVYIAPGQQYWRDVTPSLFSVLKKDIVQVGCFDECLSSDHVIDLARRLTDVGSLSVPSIHAARATCLGPPQRSRAAAASSTPVVDLGQACRTSSYRQNILKSGLTGEN